MRSGNSKIETRGQDEVWDMLYTQIPGTRMRSGAHTKTETRDQDEVWGTH